MYRFTIAYIESQRSKLFETKRKVNCTYWNDIDRKIEKLEIQLEKINPTFTRNHYVKDIGTIGNIFRSCKGMRW